MDYYPADTIDHRPTVAPQIVAPLVPYQGAAMPWLTPRNIVIAIGGVVIAALGLVVASQSGVPTESIKVGTVQNVEPTSADVGKVILQNSKASLDDLKTATDLTIESVIEASINERAVEIQTEAKRQLKDKASGCYASVHGETCFITLYLSEQQKRFSSAISVRDFSKANFALFNVKAARVAVYGVKKLPVNHAMTSAAIIKENEAIINIAQQSDNAIAADMFGENQ